MDVPFMGHPTGGTAMRSQANPPRTARHVDLLAVGIVVLGVATALIHLKLGMALGPPSVRPFPLLYYLNTLGYLVLVTALYVPPLQPVRREVRWYSLPSPSSRLQCGSFSLPITPLLDTVTK
jgi:hypothetical protein